jgi:hypothetical protein
MRACCQIRHAPASRAGRRHAACNHGGRDQSFRRPQARRDRRSANMSRKINVNPGQYKVKGRERQGEDVVHEPERARFALAERRGSGRKGLPPATRAAGKRVGRARSS